MQKKQTVILTITMILLTAVLSGCVERKLTVNTEPTGCLVMLNDEEVGLSPVTVNFNWYGDYNVCISKEGYQTLKTHRNLKRPLHDRFPFDFFAQVLYPKKIVNAYEWTFQLEPKQTPTREQLIENAGKLKEQL